MSGVFRSRRRGPRQDVAQVNLTPLIDVLFNLLIFVLATASMAAMGEIPVDLPGSTRADEGVPEAVVVSIGADLAMAVDGQRVTFEALEGVLAGALEGSGARAVTLRADRSVPAGVLVDVYDVAARAGAERVAVATEAVR